MLNQKQAPSTGVAVSAGASLLVKVPAAALACGVKNHVLAPQPGRDLKVDKIPYTVASQS